MREGYGVLRMKNGDRYEGDWSSSYKDGKGTYYFANGDRFEVYFLIKLLRVILQLVKDKVQELCIGLKNHQLLVIG